MINTKLKQIAQDLTGLELKIDNRYRTSLQTHFDTKNNNKITKQYIGFSKKQIDNLEYTLFIRGYNTKNLDIAYIQILLHEIAHYKQLTKIGCPVAYDVKYKKDKDYFETLADRYALRYYKLFV